MKDILVICTMGFSVVPQSAMMIYLIVVPVEPLQRTQLDNGTYKLVSTRRKMDGDDNDNPELKSTGPRVRPGWL